MEKKNNKKGFTLAELLIVVAIIAVLVAIAIPVFTTQLEKSKEATDVANLRAAYAAGQVAAMTGFVGTTAVTDGDYYFNPGVDGSLVTSAPSLKIGKGTATDGKADVSGLPSSIVTYTGTTVAKDKDIKVTIANGVVTAVAFA